MKIVQPKRGEGKEYWDYFIERHPDVKLKDTFIVYTWHGENVITKEFAAFNEIDREFGEEWEDERKNNGERTKRKQTWIHTKYRFIELHPIETETNLKRIIDAKYDRDNIVSFMDNEEWEDYLKEEGFDKVYVQWVARSW